MSWTLRFVLLSTAIPAFAAPLGDRSPRLRYLEQALGSVSGDPSRRELLGKLLGALASPQGEGAARILLETAQEPWGLLGALDATGAAGLEEEIARLVLPGLEFPLWRVRAELECSAGTTRGAPPRVLGPEEVREFSSAVCSLRETCEGFGVDLLCVLEATILYALAQRPGASLEPGEFGILCRCAAEAYLQWLQPCAAHREDLAGACRAFMGDLFDSGSLAEFAKRLADQSPRTLP